jgi:AcrR family transcriptional regulator
VTGAIHITTATHYHHGNLRQALLDEASVVLESEGADAISLRALARKLGVSHAAPGHHFKDRNELMAELAADGYWGLADAMEDAMSECADPRLWRIATGKAYIEFGLANPERYRMMFASRLMSGDCPERLIVASSRAYDLLLKASHGVEPNVDPTTYVMEVEELAAWSLVHGAMMLWLDDELSRSLTEVGFRELMDRVLTAQLG